MPHAALAAIFVGYAGIPFIALGVLAIGILAFRSNPQRRVNAMFLSVSIHVSVWLSARYLTGVLESLPWLRITVFIGTFWFLHLLISIELILRPKKSLLQILRSEIIWVTITAALAAFSFTNKFTVYSSAPDPKPLSAGYNVYVTLMGILYVYLVFRSISAEKEVLPAQKTELHIFSRGGVLCAISIVFLMGLRGFFGITFPFQPYVVPAFYAWIVYTITSKRVLDARQVFITLFKRGILFLIIVCLAFSFFLILGRFPFSEEIRFISAASLTAFSTMVVAPKWEKLFRLVPDMQAVRKSIFDSSREEIRLDKLEISFLEILRKWLATPEVTIIWSGSASFQIKNTILGDLELLNLLKNYQWVTPELLTRTRSSKDSDKIASFLSLNNFKAVVLTESTGRFTFIGVGPLGTGEIYTFPLVEQLSELCAIIGNIYERSHHLDRAQQAEHLASIGLVGATIAHEIRNPLVSIKTFIQLLEVNDSVEFKKQFLPPIINELSRIDRLTQQLMDLSRPRSYQFRFVSINEILNNVLGLIENDAKRQGVDFSVFAEDGDDSAWTDPEAIAQVLLNLFRNSMQAAYMVDRKPWIKIQIRPASENVQLSITDNGPGIPPAIFETIFQPFKTTKTNGFGLGLTVCKDIVTALHGAIRVEPPIEGAGAIIHLLLPRNTIRV